jgi:hypothetical protein
MQKQLFIFLALTLSSATIFCSDEFKEKTSDTSNTKPSPQKAINKDAVIAFMLSTILPLAQEGKKEFTKDFDTLWTSSDALGRQYLFLIDNNEENAVIGFSDEPDVDKSSPSPLNSHIEDTHYELRISEDEIAFGTKLKTLNQMKAFFEKVQKESSEKLPKITIKNAKEDRFLNNRYSICKKLFPRAKKPAGK